LWVSVIMAFWSMYDYISYFLTENRKRKALGGPVKQLSRLS